MKQHSPEPSVSTTTPDSGQVNSHDVQTIGEAESTSHSTREIPKLSLEIPTKPVIFTKFQDGEGSHQSPFSSKGVASSSGGFLRGFSFKNKSKLHDGEKSHLLNSNHEAVAGSPTLSRVMSKFKSTRCSPLPRPEFESPPSVSTPPASARTASEFQRSFKGVANKSISRSLSVPGKNIVIVRSPSLAGSKGHKLSDLHDDQITPVSLGCENDEEIPEDEAICRICFDACEEGNTLKMECSCKGDLQLIHEECAVKWFSTRRNRNCDVCGQEVLNLPVTLLRAPSVAEGTNGQEQSRHAMNAHSISSWQDFVVLVIISSICYFFFLEQLLIQDLKTQAIIIAAPFAFTLGVSASVLAVMLAIKEYIWTFAAVEFAFVAIIFCLFYNVLHLNAVYALLLSSILGFSITLSLNSIYIHMFYWRIRPADNSSNV